MGIQIRRAKPDEAGVLTELAHAAKRHWGYPENWIAQWKTELTITAEFISQNEVFVATADNEIIGCCALVLTDSLAEIEHMWIRPDQIGGGLGRALFNYAKQRAENLGVSVLELSADPNAERFYEKMGAKRIGGVPAQIAGHARVLPRMRINLNQGM
jgi:N-acetylglutamate synthase-like GNAT family acetyltransferase